MNLYSLDFTELLVHLLRERLATYLQHHLQPDQQISVKVLFLPPQSLSNFCMGNFSGDLHWGLWLAKKSKGMPMLDQREVDTAIHRGSNIGKLLKTPATANSSNPGSHRLSMLQDLRIQPSPQGWRISRPAWSPSRCRRTLPTSSSATKWSSRDWLTTPVQSFLTTSTTSSLFLWVEPLSTFRLFHFFTIVDEE